MRRLNLKIELRDAKRDPVFTQELVQGGGKLKVPCLRIPGEDGSVRWLYESGDIVQYLEQRFRESSR
jgi:glutathione S-transferase